MFRVKEVLLIYAFPEKWGTAHFAVVIVEKHPTTNQQQSRSIDLFPSHIQPTNFKTKNTFFNLIITFSHKSIKQVKEAT